MDAVGEDLILEGCDRSSSNSLAGCWRVCTAASDKHTFHDVSKVWKGEELLQVGWVGGARLSIGLLISDLFITPSPLHDVWFLWPSLTSSLLFFLRFSHFWITFFFFSQFAGTSP